MIRPCTDKDFDAILAVINDGAQAYRGVIPADCWHEPYMSATKLQKAIDQGVRFSGNEHDGVLLGVMGIQSVQDVTLIRHAYVRTSHRRHGMGGQRRRVHHDQERRVYGEVPDGKKPEGWAKEAKRIGTWTSNWTSPTAVAFEK